MKLNSDTILMGLAGALFLTFAGIAVWVLLGGASEPVKVASDDDSTALKRLIATQREANFKPEVDAFMGRTTRENTEKKKPLAKTSPPSQIHGMKLRIKDENDYLGEGVRIVAMQTDWGVWEVDGAPVTFSFVISNNSDRVVKIKTTAVMLTDDYKTLKVMPTKETVIWYGATDVIQIKRWIDRELLDQWKVTAFYTSEP